LKQGLNVRQAEELVRRLLGQSREQQRPARETPPQIRALETRFREALGTKVDLAHTDKGSGRIVIHFYSDEELDALYERIVGLD
jgi:ParB family chromosome partitioning protein